MPHSPTIAQNNENKRRMYEMFAHKPPPPNLIPSTQNLFEIQTQDIFSTKVEQMMIELDRLIKQAGNIQYSMLPAQHDITLVMRQIPLLVNQSGTPALFRLVIERVIYQLYQSETGFAVEIYTRFLKSLLELSPVVAREVQSWILYAEDDRKFNPYATASFIRFGFIPLEEFDVQLSRSLHSTQEDTLIDYTTNLLTQCLLTAHPLTQLDDHFLTIKALMRIKSASTQEWINHLAQRLSNQYNRQDAFSLRLLLAEWNRLCRFTMTSKDLYKQFCSKMFVDIMTDVDKLCFFFRLCTETCIETYQPGKKQLMGAYTKLIRHMLELRTDYSFKITLMSHALSVIVLVLAHYHEHPETQFNQKPFLKLISSLFIELKNTGEEKEMVHSFIILYSDTLYTLQPLYFPGFAFSWLQLFSHRLFLPLLLSTDRQGWAICHKLMVAQLKFLQTLLQQKTGLRYSSKLFYQGTLRFLVAILHDYPEFLSEYYTSFIDLLPLNCIQLRNVILSAFPSSMILPDPFTLPSDYLDTMNELPPLMTKDDEVLQDEHFQSVMDDYLSGQSKSPIGTHIIKYITMADGELHPIKLNRLIFYIGIKSKVDPAKPLSENSAIRIYKYLLVYMKESYGHYLLFNAIADHLRYPNHHTHFFSTAILHLFLSQSDTIKEQITRVLLERLIVNRPHPWGLLTTFIQLLKTPNFRDHDFVRCSPDIERLFQNVSKSIQRMS